MAFSLSDWDGSGGGGKLPVKAELTTSPGISVLEGPTTNVKSGTKASTSKAAVKRNLRSMSKKDLTAEEYYNPLEPTYTSGDLGLGLLSKMLGLTKLPIVGENIKKIVDAQNEKEGNIFLDLGTKILAQNPSLVNYPIIGDFIKKQAYELGKLRSSPTRQSQDINFALGFSPTKQQQEIQNLKKINNDLADYTGIEPNDLGEKGTELDLFRQYIYQDQNLTPSTYKPLSDYYEFLPSYSLKSKLGSSKSDSVLKSMLLHKPKYVTSKDDAYASLINKNEDKLAAIHKKQSSDLESVIKTHKPVFYSVDSETPNLDLSLFYNARPDLGHYKSSFGWDKELNLPYASVSDAWDFYPKDYAEAWGDGKDMRNTSAYQQSYLMHKAGKPYKIYDRVYIDPKTKKTISDKEILKRRNMLKSMKKTK
jgi:hypothetical protein